MTIRLFYSLRWKLLALFVLGFLLSATTLVGIVAAILISQGFGFRLPYDLASELHHMFGWQSVLIVSGIVLFVLYIFLLSRRRLLYLASITKTVQGFAAGQLEERIPVRYNDEMGDLAVNLNTMARQLKTSIEDERRAERTKSELITNVSHDLRTPLTSISGYLGLIEQDKYRDEVELRHYVRIAYEKTKRMQSLIDDLFEYARLSGGGLVLRKSSLDLVELTGQLTAQLQYELGKSGMEIRLLFPERSVMIEADGDKLARVLDNLLANAMNYGKDGVFIDVEVRVEEQWAVLAVANYGAPIPEQDLPHIFERFYRVEKSRSEETGGSGLGLAISKHIVELHGGGIAAASDDKRTVFELRLPLSSASSDGLRNRPGGRI